jgi:uncharacterized SAM-binding protein YcdF (DUF218 family)
MIALVITGIFFIQMLQRVPNMRVVFYLVLGFFSLLIIYLVLWTLAANEKHGRLSRVLRRIYLVIIAIGLTFFLVLQGLIISGGRTDDSGADVDCLIVLGAGLRNGVPGLILAQRLNTAIDYLRERGDIPVIVTGGLGRGETVTEAEAMHNYLRRRGVDESLIWVEDMSTSTRENLTFSLALLEKNGLDAESIKVAVVTNEFHLYRSKLIAGKRGLDAIGIAAATPNFFLRTLYSCREAFALASELLF